MPARKEKAAKRSRIGAARERWEKEVLSPVIAKSPERRKRFESTSGEAIERLYTPQDPEPFDYLKDAGFPGEYPFTRGVQPTMSRGRVGVAIDSIEDMAVLFDRIPLGTVSTSMTINSTAAILLAMYIAVGESQGVPP